MTTTFILNNGVESPPSASASSRPRPTRPPPPSRPRCASGYRHIDTAAAYGNERGVGDALRRMRRRPRRGVHRDQGLDQRLRLRRDPPRLRQERRQARRRPDRPAHPAPGPPRRVRPHHRRLQGARRPCSPTARFEPSASATSWPTTSSSSWRRPRSIPAVNQVEVHPYFRQPDVLAADATHGILTQAWSPIGGITFYRPGRHSSTLEDPTIAEHRRSPRQDAGPGHAALARAAGPFGHPQIHQPLPNRREPRRLRLRAHRRRLAAASQSARRARICSRRMSACPAC